MNYALEEDEEENKQISKIKTNILNKINKHLWF